MSRLFLSYRRSDSPDTVKILCERLKARLPRWEIFYDHESIPAGQAFPERLHRGITAATVVLAIIGPRWLDILRERRTLPVDHVREEIRLALESAGIVIPVPVLNASIPSAADLADIPELLALPSLNARPVRPDPDFNNDLDRLAAFLEPFGPSVDVGTVLGGKYRLVRQVGEGGMGVVYQAEQLAPKRTVAVKLVKPGMDSKEVLARFDAERQALSAMNHANIAKVLDAGVTPGGRPFFVMDFVRGEPITQYCDHKKLTTADRLGLFRQVCEAVQHAHQKGIVHRDIKPTNVLVEVIDGKPVPKVIDFGLAKAMSYKLTDKTLVSELGKTVGTLLYSSPEQAAGRTNDIDTRTDIYALGVVLYEMLAGELPFTEAELLSAGDAAMKGRIAHAEPPKPSAKLSSSNTLPTIAANRQLDPARLTRLIRGELDWIVMKSLEKDPDRRYASATGFADDVRRYLAGERVEAVPPSVGYRLRKFVRKNHGPVTAAGLLLLTLLGGMAGTTIGFLRAKAAEASEGLRADAEAAAKIAATAAEGLADERRVRAETAESLAEKRRVQAEVSRDQARQRFQLALDAFDQMVFGLQNKLASRPGTQDLRKDLLENARTGLQKLLKESENQGEPDRTLWASHIQMGKVDLVLGRTRPAQHEFQAALKVAELMEADNPKSARAQRDLGISLEKLGDVALQLGQTREALDYYKRGLAIAEKLAADDPGDARAQRDLGISLEGLGDVTQELGRPREALDYYKRELTIAQKLSADDPEDARVQRSLSISFNRLGDVTDKLGQTREALGYYKRGLAIAEKLAADDPEDARAQSDLGVSFDYVGGMTLQLGQPKEALDYQKRGLAIREKLAADDPKNADVQRNLGVSFGGIGDAALQLGQPKEALGYYKRGLAITQKLAEDDPGNARAQRLLSASFDNLGDATLRLGQPKEALGYYKRGLAIREKLAAGDPGNAEAQTDLYVSYLKLGSFEEAQKNFAVAIGYYKKGRLILLPLHEKKLLVGRFKDEFALVDEAILTCQQAIKTTEQGPPPRVVEPLKN